MTPMLAQYLRVKQQVGDAVLFFRLGDFYEMFFEDAERAAPLLDVTLTSRNKDDPNPIPMCGVPHHAALGYIGKLLAHGVKVAICDQVGEPSTSPGLIERGLTRIITPGTVLDEDEGLATSEPGYLAALGRGAGDAIAIATVEASTGELRCCETEVLALAREELARIGPREVLFPEGDEVLGELARDSQASVTARPVPASPAAPEIGRTLERVLGAAVAASRAGVAPGGGALRSALEYLAETLRGGLEHLSPAHVYTLGDHLMLDPRSRKNLAVVEGTAQTRHGSLWWAVDRTTTAMGARRLREWLLYPLLDLHQVGERLDAVEALVEAPGLRSDVAASLRPAGDVERLVARLSLGRAGPRELVRLSRTLERAAAIHGLLAREARPALLERIADGVAPPQGVAERIAALLVESPPLAASEGGTIREGADGEVDRLRALTRDAQGLIAALEARERAASGIGSLKVRYQRVFGYFFEVTKANLGSVPAHFVRRQTIANGERFTTPELRDLEQQLTTADERCRQREAALFADLLADVRTHEAALLRLARELANLDALAGLATTAHEQGYVRPSLHRGRALVIRDGRHPVVERTSAQGCFVANDATLDEEGEQVVVLTGPNMAGKSTYLRQVALIVLLAHAGSFVPASEAQIPLTDRIWTRVGAGDDLVAGDSTFMVEMKETAAILANLTPRTLVVLDEIGRGTSTYDGIAIAWAVAEYLHDVQPAPGARVKTLFATHFHELTALAEILPRVRNHSVAVREWKDDVLFLRRVVPGAASRSYGVSVARLAGVPDQVVKRARDILAGLEEGKSLAGASPPGQRRRAAAAAQLGLFADRAQQLRRELAAIDVEKLTPLEALTRLHELALLAREE
ncbi:MAG: DNA mismatch repair protein MutS [Deltaproteobacteria bacterium]|nr:DNA mismatch repair protein MutS [Deltaproteobacteria bacterium]